MKKNLAKWKEASHLFQTVRLMEKKNLISMPSESQVLGIEIVNSIYLHKKILRAFGCCSRGQSMDHESERAPRRKKRIFLGGEMEGKIKDLYEK